jgi:hypothetical protein
MMKKFVLLALLACVCVLPMHAATIVSNALTTNSTANPTVDLTTLGSVNPSWFNISGADWISIANTGNPGSPTFVVEPNGTAVTFTDTFSLLSLPTTATLSVLADDTTSVVVDGITVWNATSGPFPTCSTPIIGCLSTSEGIFNVVSDLHTGSNTIAFQTIQGNLSSYGLDFALVTATATATPEPGALLMLGSGLIGLIGLGGLRRRSMIGF